MVGWQEAEKHVAHVQKPCGSIVSGVYIRGAAGDYGPEDTGGDQVKGTSNGVPSESWDCLPLSLYFPNFNEYACFKKNTENNNKALFEKRKIFH